MARSPRPSCTGQRTLLYRGFSVRQVNCFPYLTTWMRIRAGGGTAYFRRACSCTEDKKGADRGFDGNIYFRNGPYGVGRITALVKGGENIGVHMVRDLRGVIEREEVEMGIMVTPCAKYVFVRNRRLMLGQLARGEVEPVANLVEAASRKLDLPNVTRGFDGILAAAGY